MMTNNNNLPKAIKESELPIDELPHENGVSVFRCTCHMCAAKKLIRRNAIRQRMSRSRTTSDSSTEGGSTSSNSVKNKVTPLFRRKVPKKIIIPDDFSDDPDAYSLTSLEKIAKEYEEFMKEEFHDLNQPQNMTRDPPAPPTTVRSDGPSYSDVDLSDLELVFKLADPSHSDVDSSDFEVTHDVLAAWQKQYADDVARPEMGIFSAGLDKSTLCQLARGNDNLEDLIALCSKFLTPELSSDFGKFLNTTSGLTPATMNEAVASVRDFSVGATNVVVLQATSGIVFIGALAHSVSTRSKTSMALAVAALITLLFNSNRELFISKCGDLFSSFVALVLSVFSVEENDEAVPEIGISNITDFTKIGATVLSFITCMGAKDLPKEIFKNLGQLGRVNQTIEDVLKSSVSIFEATVNWVRNNLLGESSVRFFDTHSKDFDDYIDDCITFFDRLRDFGHGFDQGLFEHGINLKEKGVKLMRGFPNTRELQYERTILQNHLARLDKFRDKMLELKKMPSCVRQEPVIVCLTGGPGVAKSLVLERLSKAACIATLSDLSLQDYFKNESNYVYNRIIEHGYYDGYSNSSHVMLFDDFLQNKIVLNEPDNEPANILRLGSQFDYTLHMAHVDEKGQKKFGCKFVFMTTNSVDLKSNALESNEALRRRIDVNVFVVPKPEFVLDSTRDFDLMSRKFDYSKLAKKVNSHGVLVTQLDHTCVDFYLRSKDKSDLSHVKKLSFDELFELTHGLYRTKEARHISNLDGHAALTDEFVLKYRQPPTVQMEAVPQSGLPDCILKLKKSFEKVSEPEDLTMHFGSDIIEAVEEAIAISTHSSNGTFVHDRAQELYEELDVLIAIKGKSRKYKLCYATHLYGPDYLAQYFDGDFYSDEEYVSVDEEAPYIKWYSDSFVKMKGFCSRLVHKWIDSLGGPQSWIFSYKGGIVGTGVIIFGLGLYSLVKKIFPSEDTVAHSINYGSKLAKGKPKSNWHGKIPVLSKPQAGFSNDNNANDIAKSVDEKRTYVLKYHDPVKGESKLGTAFHIAGRVVAVPYHFVLTLYDMTLENEDLCTARLSLRLNTGNEHSPVYNVTVMDFINGHRTGLLLCNDMVLVTIADLPTKSSVVKHFVNEADMPRLSKGFDFAMKLRDADDIKVTHTGVARVLSHELTVKCEQGDYKVASCVAYNSFTSVGDCGGLCVRLDPQCTRKIVGMHVAGVPGKQGFAAIVTQEALNNDLAMFPDEPVEGDIFSEAGHVKYSETEEEFSRGQCNVLARVSPSPSTPGNTKIVKSKLYGLFGEVTTCPAQLRAHSVNGIRIDPMGMAYSKLSPFTYLPDMDLGIIEQAMDDWYANMMQRSTYPHERDILNIYEAIFGDPENSFSNSIPSGTSAGFPENVDAFQFKKRIFKLGRDAYKGSELEVEFTSVIKKLVRGYMDNQRPMFIFTDFPKDERLDITKVSKGKVRFVSGCPFLYLVLVRMYFGRFSMWITENKIQNGCVKGVNPYSLDWTELYHELSRFDDFTPMVGAGDYKAFDASERREILKRIVDYINRWYDDGLVNARVRELLWLELYNSRHLSNGLLYELLNSLPSGHPLTTEVNTIYNHVAANYAWKRLVSRTEFMYDHVVYVAMGDDNIFTVSRKYRHLFNEMTIAAPMRELGLTYTADNKLESTMPFRPIYDVEFLKRSFIKVTGNPIVKAPLRLAVIKDMINWDKRGSAKGAVGDTVTEALNELSLHPEEDWDECASCIIEAYERNYPDERPNIPFHYTYRQRQARVLNSEYYLC